MRERVRRLQEEGKCILCCDPGNYRCSKCRIRCSQYTKDWRQRNLAHALVMKKALYQKRRAWINTFKKKCSQCNETHPACLDFHHREPSKKNFTIASGTYNSKKAVEREITKCDVLCKNCHAKLHYSNTHGVPSTPLTMAA